MMVLHSPEVASRRGAVNGRGRHVCRAFLVLLGATTAVGACTGPTSAADDVAATIDDGLDAYFDIVDSTGMVRAVIVQHRGEPVLERYTGAGPDDYWNVESVGKSVMSSLVGIAIDQGHLQGVDQTLGELLPGRADAMTPDVAAVTLEELLSHTAGFTGPASATSHEQVFFSPDWVLHALVDPGPDAAVQERFTYSSAGSHLLSPILVEATGQSVLEYARANLFDPLGIPSEPTAEPLARFDENGAFASASAAVYDAADFAWPVDPQGYHLGAGLIKLRPQDLARFGQLYLDDGAWQGEQVVPASWVEQSTSPHADTQGSPDADAYGYLWWLTEYEGEHAFLAIGSGVQMVGRCTLPNGFIRGLSRR